MYALTKFVFQFALGIVRTLFHIFLIQVTWKWFIVPEFHVAELSRRGALGLSFLASLATIGLTMHFAMDNLKARAIAKDESAIDGSDKWDDRDWALTETILTVAVIYPLSLLITYMWSYFLP